MTSINTLDLVRYDPTRNCFVLKGTNMYKQTCNCHPDSPFHWAHNQRPSIFAQDVSFRPKGGADRGIGQTQAEVLEKRRAAGEAYGHMHGIGQHTAEKEKQLIAYKQFGIYSKAGPSLKKANKHEQ